MNNTDLLGIWIRRFLMEYLIGDRNLTRNTQVSYRDTLTLLLPFASEKVKKPVDRLCIEDISSGVIRTFLLHLKEDRGCSVSTCNQRLASIHALARFIGMNSLHHIAWCTEIRSIPFKKISTSVMCYLEKPEMDALLDAPYRNSLQGSRDYALMLFLYNTGARASEAAQVTVSDMNLDSSLSSVRIVGKAGKVRHCPLWRLTCDVLSPLLAGRGATENVFLNRRKQPITRSGIYAIVKRYVVKAGLQVASLSKKSVSPHSIRHTTAVHLLRAGVDINTIRAWLGHVSLDTTHIYAEIDMEMKSKALAHCEIITTAPIKKQWRDKKIMDFLRTM